MDSVQLTQILSANPYTRRTFFGVFPCDMLPRARLLQRPVSLIVNTHPHTLPGEHWLAIYLTEDKNGEFFDSYGHPPDHPLFPETIMKFLTKNARKIAFHPQQIQAPDSVVCGHHCVFFLQQRCKGLTFKQIQELYSYDLQGNDRMVLQFIKNKKNVCARGSSLFQTAQGCVSCVAFHSHVF